MDWRADKGFQLKRSNCSGVDQTRSTNGIFAGKLRRRRWLGVENENPILPASAQAYNQEASITYIYGENKRMNEWCDEVSVSIQCPDELTLIRLIVNYVGSV
jgi:hypothetical protein